jgi:predicted transcriptional regulator
MSVKKDTVAKYNQIAIEHIRNIRTILGLSQREIGNMTGVVHTVICRYEQGNIRVPAWYLLKLYELSGRRV